MKARSHHFQMAREFQSTNEKPRESHKTILRLPEYKDTGLEVAYDFKNGKKLDDVNCKQEK